MTILAANFEFPFLLSLLTWLAFGGVAFLAFKKTQAKGHLLTLVGAGVHALVYLIWMVGTPDMFMIGWLPWIATSLIAAGFYLGVQSIVAGDLAALKGKIHAATTPKQGGGSPPAGGGPASS